MAADLQLIFGTIGVSQMISDLTRLEGRAMSLGSVFTSVTQSLSGPAGIGAIGTIIGDVAIKAGKAAIEYETLSTQFSVFLGSAEKATQVLADLNKFSIETPFTPDEVNKAGRSLLAFGVTTENLIPTLKAVGDVSSAVGKDFNELAQIYGKAKTANQLFAEDINQLTGAGIPIIEELAKVMGVGVDQVKKLGSQGKIHFAELEKAFQNMTSEGGRFNSMMDKMSQTTAGLISTIEGKLQDELRNIGMAMLPTIKTIVSGMEPAINSLKSAIAFILEPIASFGESIGNLFKAFGFVSSDANAFAEIVKVLAFTTKVALTPLRGLLFVLEKAADLFTWARNGLKNLTAQMPLLGTAVKFLLGPIGMLNEAIGFLGNLFGSSGQAAEDAAARYKHLQDTVAQTVVQMGGGKGDVSAFIKTIDQAQFAGLSQAEALQLLQLKFKIYLDDVAKAKKATDEFGKSLDGVSIDMLKEQLAQLEKQFTATTSAAERASIGAEIERIRKQIETMSKTDFKAGPLTGSIDFINAQLKRLREAFTATDSELKRISIGKAIEGYEFQLMKFGATVDKLKGQQAGTILDPNFAMPQRTLETLDAVAGSLSVVNAELTTTGKIIEFISRGSSLERAQVAFEQLKDGAKQIGDAFKQFAVDAAFAFGEAIAGSGKFGQSMAQLLTGLGATITKLAGMALLNASISLGPTPAALGMALAGLGLIGLSGAIGALGRRNQQSTSGPSLATPNSGMNTPSRSGIGEGGRSAFEGMELQLVMQDGTAMPAYIRRAGMREGRRRG